MDVSLDGDGDKQLTWGVDRGGYQLGDSSLLFGNARSVWQQSNQYWRNPWNNGPPARTQFLVFVRPARTLIKLPSLIQ